jgi:hypothetical protein
VNTTLLAKVGNKNTIFDPNESFWYVCESQGSTFPNDTNTIIVSAVTADTFKVPITREDKTTVKYDDSPGVKIDIVSGDDHALDEQDLALNNGKATFYIRISNNGSSPLDTISTTSLTAASCNRTALQL